MLTFYMTLFGLKITDKGRGRTFQNDLVFLSAHPEHHHQLVLSSGRPADATFSTVMQLSFKAQAIDDLRRISAAAPRLGASKLFTLNHGNALSVYFCDPEGSTVEVYFDTLFYVAQPHGDPLDLSKSDEEILRETELACRADPSFMTAEEWRRKFVASSAGT
jgi:catechol 2,3-dioxygenase